MSKIKTLPALKKTLAAFRKQNKRIVLTNGCFDLLHRGHCEYLKKARQMGDLLVVGLNSDASVHRLKRQGRPLTKQADRAAVLAALESVDFVTIFNEDTPFRVIKEIRPDVLVKGGDWDKNKVVGKDIVESYGGTVKLVKFLKGYSTTKILKEIR